jgi:hypothetical protein
MDSEDQLRSIRRLLKSMELDENDLGAARGAVVHQRRRRTRACGRRSSTTRATPSPAQLIRLYARYTACLQRPASSISPSCCCAPTSCGATTRLLAQYRRRFRTAGGRVPGHQRDPVRWLRLLAGDTGIPFVVGDDDQSIYRWRGARVENLQRFQRDFPAHAHQAGAELPLDRTILQGRQRHHREQQRAARQEPVDRRQRAATPIRLYGPTTSATRPSSSSAASRTGSRRATSAARRRCCTAPTPSPACSRRRCCAAGCLPRLRRPALFRARRDQGRTGLPAADRQPRRRPVVRAGRQQPTRGIGARTMDLVREHARRQQPVACGPRPGHGRGGAGGRAAKALWAFLSSSTAGPKPRGLDCTSRWTT